MLPLMGAYFFITLLIKGVTQLDYSILSSIIN